MSAPSAQPGKSEQQAGPGPFRVQQPTESPAAWVRQLSTACARGDRAAMDAAHVRFAPGLRTLFVRRVGEQRTDLADDLCQRTWTMTWEAILAGKYDPSRAAISTFVYAVANNAWLRHLRSLGRASLNGRSAELDELEAMSGDRGGGGTDQAPAESIIESAENLDVLRAALADRSSPDALTPDELAVVSGSAQGESDRALAARLGFAPSTINGKKRAGLDKLRRALERAATPTARPLDPGVDPHAAPLRSRAASEAKA